MLAHIFRFLENLEIWGIFGKTEKCIEKNQNFQNFQNIKKSEKAAL